MTIAHQINLTDDAHTHLAREWLLTNGTGAYAMGTLPGVNTRRYHGLLVAAADPPVGRVVAVSQMLERLTLHHQIGKQTIEFSTLAFQDEQGNLLLHPGGLTWLRRVDKGLSMAWGYMHGHIQFVRELFLHDDQQAITLRYRVAGLTSDQRAELYLHPMLTLRDFHSVQSAPDAAMQVRADGDVVTAASAQQAVTLHCPGFVFTPSPDWWRDVHYPVETQRGQEDREQLFVPGWFEVPMAGGQMGQVLLTARLGEQPAIPQPVVQPRQARIEPMAQRLLGESTDARDRQLAEILAIAADDFVVRRHMAGRELSTILAGYPWFADWGRDTFIAMEGLLLCTGRLAEARATLQAFAGSIRDGLVPNRFDDYDQQQAHYNTVDASLWFIHAAMRYLAISHDRDSWNHWLRAAVCQVIDAYQQGTRYDIRMDSDGLITAGNEKTQLTWMDAACGDTIFTPRHGKAVEINALWHHALLSAADLLREDDPKLAEGYSELARRGGEAFVRLFWDESRGYLADHLICDHTGQWQADWSLRPNQILAVSLPHSPLPAELQQRVVDAVGSRLLTPFGLRTLPTDDPSYHGHYAGEFFQRDKAYHQGTVWPWLIGPYAEAVLRAGGFSRQARADALRVIEPLLGCLLGEGEHPSMGQLHEIHEADPPHRPVGCMAQAWSVAEVIRVWQLAR